MKKLFILPLIITFLFIRAEQVFAQSGTITVHIKEIENTKGLVNIGLYNSAEYFTGHDKFFKGARIAASKLGVDYTFTDIPIGTYAISVWHDENKNKEIDTNWLGIPTEKYGFSLNKYGTFGPPDFEDVSFKIESNQTQSITIKLK